MSVPLKARLAHHMAAWRVRAVPPFSQAGLVRVLECTDEYIDQLTDESLKMAERGRADTISAMHVTEAASRLSSVAIPSVYRHLGTIGGLLLGTGIQQIVAMVSDGKLTPLGTGLGAGFAVVGAFLVAIHMARD